MMSKKQTALLTVVFLAAVAVFALEVFAEEAEQPEAVTLQGMVSVAKDDAGGIISVQLSTDDAIYEVDLDDKGIELGEEMEGKKVEVNGIVTEEDGTKYLVVHEYAEISE